MKTKKQLLLIIALLGITQLCAQPSLQETMAKFELAQDNYENKNYVKALEYLRQISDSNAKAKVSYLSSKCYENLISAAHSINVPDSIYAHYIKSINDYLNVGKDEAKKTELMKLKIQTEDSRGYKVFKEFENTSSDEAFKIIQKIIAEYPALDDFDRSVKSITISENCELEVFLQRNWGSRYGGEIDLYFINLSNSYIDNGVAVKVINPSSFQFLTRHYLENEKKEFDNFEKKILKYKSDIKNKGKSKIYFQDFTDVSRSFPLGCLTAGVSPTYYKNETIKSKLFLDQERITKAFQVIINGCVNEKK